MLSQMLQKVAVLSYLEGSCIVNNTRLESRESNLYIGSSIFNDDIILSGDNSPGDATHHGRNKARDEGTIIQDKWKQRSPSLIC